MNEKRTFVLSLIFTVYILLLIVYLHNYTVTYIALQDLLENPNPNDPANGQAADLYKRNQAEYSRKTKAYAAKCVPDV